MARLIDADVLRQTIESKIYWGGVGLLEAIDDAPSVNAVEVVRCKDCEFFSSNSCIGIMPGYGFEVEPNDFCSKGERRTDNERKAD